MAESAGPWGAKIAIDSPGPGLVFWVGCGSAWLGLRCPVARTAQVDSCVIERCVA